MNLAELREKLNRIATEMRDLHKAAMDEDRAFTSDDTEKWNQLQADYDATEAMIQRAQRIAELDAVAPQERRAELVGFDDNGDDDPEEVRWLFEGREPTNRIEGRSTPGYNAAFERFLRKGVGSLSTEERAVFDQNMAPWAEEFRALGTTSGAVGGFTVPEDFAGFITQRMVDFSGLREAAGSNRGPTLLRTARGNNLPFPTNDDSGNAGVIVTENAATTEQDTTFGERTLGSYMYSSRIIRVSWQLLQDEAVNLQAYLARILGERVGRAQAPHYAAGTGTGQPTGLTTAATDAGVNVSVAAGVTYANLLDFEHGLDPAYRRQASWGFNDTLLRALKGLVDGQSRPLWLPGLAASIIGDQVAQSTLMGYPYIVDQGYPALSVGNRFMSFGDMSQYYIREVVGISLFRFDEKYADSHQTGWMAYARADGNLIDVNSNVTDIAVA